MLCVMRVHAKIHIDSSDFLTAKLQVKFIKAEIFSFSFCWSSKLAVTLSPALSYPTEPTQKRNILSPCLKEFQLQAWLIPSPCMQSA